MRRNSAILNKLWSNKNILDVDLQEEQVTGKELSQRDKMLKAEILRLKYTRHVGQVLCKLY